MLCNRMGVILNLSSIHQNIPWTASQEEVQPDNISNNIHEEPSMMLGIVGCCYVLLGVVMMSSVVGCCWIVGS